MANSEHLQVLKRGEASWNAWRDEHPELKPNLSRADLSGADLRGANLSGARLKEAKLSRADLSGANLNGADLNQAQLSGARLNRATLNGAHLNWANLSEANLNEATLNGATLNGADLSQAQLIGATLNGANLNGANLGAANLGAADLRAAQLRAADLRAAQLRAADLRAAQLRAADLRAAQLRAADLRAAQLRAADLSVARLGGTLFVGSFLADTKGLDSVKHIGPSTLDHVTFENSPDLPLVFLRGIGLPDWLIESYQGYLGSALQFYSCFISYSHKDKVFARRVHDALQGRGIRCWLDEKQMLPGDDIYEGVDRGIRLWDKVLLCCSEHALTGWWVDDEIDRAFDKERQLTEERRETLQGRKVLALIPLNLDGYLLSGKWMSAKAKPVKSRLAADFTGWEKDNAKFETQLERVVSALRLDDHAQEKAPPPKL